VIGFDESDFVNVSHFRFPQEAASRAQGSVSQNPRRAKPTQLRANIEQAIAVSETNVATALMGCMTEP
jgi:hypothetical protein